jgi:hypothetical protein
MDSEKDLWSNSVNLLCNASKSGTSLSRFSIDLRIERGEPAIQVNGNRSVNTFWQVLTLALQVEQETQELSPCGTDALEAAGYTINFEDLGNTADRWLRQPLPTLAIVREIELDESIMPSNFPHGLRLDFGGVPKVGCSSNHG